jgi:hypothetical protein
MLEAEASIFLHIFLFNTENDKHRNTLNFSYYCLKSKLQSNVVPDLVIITPTEQYFS